MKAFVERLCSSSKYTLLFLAFMLFFPLFFHGYHFGIPWVKGGDEPHYLVMLNSFLNDGDFDLRNNYDSAMNGSYQAGRKFAGQQIDRHAVINDHGKLISLYQVFVFPGDLPIDQEGHPIPIMKPGMLPEYATLPQYSNHPTGIVLVLAPFLWLFRGTRFLEPMALFCCFASILMAAFLFRRLIWRYTQDEKAANAAVLLAFLGTSSWMYARSLFTEPFLLFFAVAAYFLAVEKRSGFWVGLMIGLGGLMKPNFLIMAAPVAGFYFWDKKWKEIFLLALGPVASGFIFLYLNDLLMGGPFVSPENVFLGNPFYESFYLLFSWNHGIFCFSPFLVFCLFAWKKYFLNWKSEAVLFASGFALYFVFMACISTGGWGWCYGSRHILPVLPFLMIPLVYLWDDYKKMNRWVQWSVQLAIGFSIFVNFLGALDGYWDSNPITILWGNITP